FYLQLTTHNSKTRVRDSSGNPFVGIIFSIITFKFLLQKIGTDSLTEGNAKINSIKKAQPKLSLYLSKIK
ncbi:hypothetical protein, partial [Empedobacter falsenii]|uniref:hypothetical protein n=1 Tax=Empedobacter falsenii TaxID=343874 RepID=UPI002577E158